MHQHQHHHNHTHQQLHHLRRCKGTLANLMSLGLAGRCIGPRNWKKLFTFDLLCFYWTISVSFY
uniref:Uncharacterized protein n=1 Tax=Octopus bimaculoides TaxID=37653 RepID=A0A0L8GZR8_OCTBM